MTPDEFRTALERLGLTQIGAARFLGLDERTLRRYATGEKPVPRTVEMILRIAERLGMAKVAKLLASSD